MKRSHYETFWNTHHFFVLFFTALLFHGSVWWMWAALPLGLYVFDRVVVRILLRGRTPIALARVYFWGARKKDGKVKTPDVITLQFVNAVDDKGVKPVEYMEGTRRDASQTWRLIPSRTAPCLTSRRLPSTGHYLYLQCPTVTKYPEWHPFTISSAPDEAILEVNIRVLASPLSWTNKVAKYLQLLDPTAQGEIELVTRNPTTGATTLGKVIGPNNKPFFRVDAPHGAPSQHVFVYNTALIVGAGIGVTPCASIMKGIVNYRWKKGFKPKNLYFFWVARLTDLTLFKWLVVMLPELKAKELLHNEFYDSDQQAQTGVQARMKELKAELKGLGEESQRAPHPPRFSAAVRDPRRSAAHPARRPSRYPREPCAPPLSPLAAPVGSTALTSYPRHASPRYPERAAAAAGELDRDARPVDRPAVLLQPRHPGDAVAAADERQRPDARLVAGRARGEAGRAAGAPGPAARGVGQQAEARHHAVPDGREGGAAQAEAGTRPRLGDTTNGARPRPRRRLTAPLLSPSTGARDREGLDR